MSEKELSLAGAKAHLSELTKQAAAGDDVVIASAASRLPAFPEPKPRGRPWSVALRRLTARMPDQSESTWVSSCKAQEKPCKAIKWFGSWWHSIN